MSEQRTSNQMCIPSAPLRCWQFRRSTDDPIPRWAAPWLLMQGDGTLEFVWPNNGGQQEIPDGFWLVLLDDGRLGEPWCGLYSDDEFNDLFNIVRHE